jgi:thymidylate synthase (FAD)
VSRVDLYDDKIGFVELVDSVGSDLSVVNSARVSFGRHKEAMSEKDENLIKYLVENSHTSTLEHCFVTFRVKVPLFVRSQHHRHRTWSYNEISRRYTDFDIQFYETKKLRGQHESNRQASTCASSDPVLYSYEDGGKLRASAAIQTHHRGSIKLYNDLLQSGVCREQARGVLPQNMYTEYYASANLNNILKFVDLRIHDGAQWEIQRLANGILKIISNLYPVTVHAYKENKQEL